MAAPAIVLPIRRPEPARGPTFFLVGAPKCGTTALASYLADHPDIFMSDPKEPNYFVRHLAIGRGRSDPGGPSHRLESYLRLFEPAGPEALAVGEASTGYLRSAPALQEIRRFRPEARLIVQLRNPLELVRSWHLQKLWEGEETEADFERAWRLQDEREEGRQLPRGLQQRDGLLYHHVASIGSQLERLLRIFPRQQVLTLFHDDLEQSPRKLYEQALLFLGVAPDARRHFPVVNPSRVHRFPRLARLLTERPRWVERTADRLGLRGRGVAAAFQRASAAPARTHAPALSPALRAELAEAFAPEVAKLQHLTGRDLRHWLKV